MPSFNETCCEFDLLQKAIHEVLRNNMAGAHLVFITRGSPDTLSISDEQTIQVPEVVLRVLAKR